MGDPMSFDWTKIDGRAILALFLIIMLTTIVFVTLAIGWKSADIVAVSGIFAPFVAAAVAFYFGNKDTGRAIETLREQSEKLFELEKSRIDLDKAIIEKLK